MEQQIAVAKYLKASDLEIVEVFPTQLDCAVAVQAEVNGSQKTLGIEVKAETSLASKYRKNLAIGAKGHTETFCWVLRLPTV